jgi:hypothetical protein
VPEIQCKMLCKRSGRVPGTDRLLGWLCHFAACPKAGPPPGPGRPPGPQRRSGVAGLAHGGPRTQQYAGRFRKPCHLPEDLRIAYPRIPDASRAHAGSRGVRPGRPGRWGPYGLSHEVGCPLSYVSGPYRRPTDALSGLGTERRKPCEGVILGAEGGGIEPSAYGLKVRHLPDVSRSFEIAYDNADSVLGFCLATLQRHYPDLASVVAAWDNLPEAVRAGILAMVRAVCP